MLHHLVHRHHQEDDIDLSKQMRITVGKLQLDRHPISAAHSGGGSIQILCLSESTTPTLKTFHCKKKNLNLIFYQSKSMEV